MSEYAESVGSITDINSVDIDIIQEILNNEEFECSNDASSESQDYGRNRSGTRTGNSSTRSAGSERGSTTSYLSHAEISRRRRKIREPLVGHEFDHSSVQNEETASRRISDNITSSVYDNDGGHENSAEQNRKILGSRLKFLKPVGKDFLRFRDEIERRTRENGAEPYTKKALLEKYWRKTVEGIPFKRHLLHEIYTGGYVVYSRLSTFFRKMADRNARKHNILIVAEHNSHWHIIHDCQYNFHSCRCVCIEEIEREFNTPRTVSGTGESTGITKFFRRGDGGRGSASSAQQFWEASSRRLAEFEQSCNEKGKDNRKEGREIFRRFSRRVKCSSKLNAVYTENPKE